MKSFTITNTSSGVVLGTFEAATASDALEVMAHRAGYGTYAEACEAAPGDDIEVTESLSFDDVDSLLHFADDATAEAVRNALPAADLTPTAWVRELRSQVGERFDELLAMVGSETRERISAAL